MKSYKNWWTNKWFSIIEGKRLEKKYNMGKTYFQRNKEDLDFLMADGEISDSYFDYDRFEMHYFEINVEPFSEDEIDFIKNLIESSPTYLIRLIRKDFPESLNNEFLSKNIKLLPDSIKDLNLSCDCKIKYCRHLMALFHSFGQEIDKNPLLLFKLRGLNLSYILKPYMETNSNIVRVKAIEEILQMDKSSDESCNVKCSENSDELKQEQKKEALNNIDFNNIPNLKKTIDSFLDTKPDFFRRDFKTIFLRNLNHNSRHRDFLKGKDLKIDFNPFVFQRENESDSEFKRRVFLMKWDDPKYFKDLKIDLSIFYEIEKISIIPRNENLQYVLHQFFFEMDNELINEYSYSIQFAYKAYQFAESLMSKIAIMPEILSNNKVSNQYLVRWIPSLFNKDIRELFEKLSSLSPDDLVIFDGEKISKEEQVKILIGIFIGNFMELNIPKSLMEFKGDSVYNLLFNNHLVSINEYKINEINNWFWKLFSYQSKRKIVLRVSEEEDDFKINLLSEDLKPIKEKFMSLKKKHRLVFLLDVFLLDEYCPELNKAINKDEEIIYDIEEFSRFYFNKIPILESLNFKVKLPETLKKVSTPQMILNFESTGDIDPNKKGLLNLESLVDFNWKIAIGDKKIDVKEFKKLVAKSDTFIKVDGNYYIVDKKKTNKLSTDVDNLPDKLGGNEILQAILALKYENADVKVDERISNTILQINQYPEIKVPQNLNGVLRDYQQRGFSWLVQNTFTGFGSILADDMGLGKTLEILTAILYFKNKGFLNKQKVLVIAPTAILFNWENEIKKFTPDLSLEIYHGMDRKINPEIDIIITSFGMIRSDFKEFKKFKWFMIVVDEAQNIKNPSAIQTKAVKKLESINKVALTGTPVENKLTDYWSIFDFTNKNYLHNNRKFKKIFVNPIEKENDGETLENFKNITAPFVLRRLKTDKNVINDLPEKITNDCYCFLSNNQTAMYQKEINTILNEIKVSDGIKRKGLVLKLINSLKQICNHPSQYLKSDNFVVEESGKMEMLVDILENTEENNEKVVIFTQFVQMGNIIAELLEEKFNIDVLFYHGGLTRKNRDKIIDNFQNSDENRVMIVSLKAGGSGLNLTAAQHVVHFDLWWNPAVENQATDRVHRIGQENNIMVYRFITKGTFEEKINQMLINKSSLAELTVGTGEKFVTEMGDKELRTLLNLTEM